MFSGAEQARLVGAKRWTCRRSGGTEGLNPRPLAHVVSIVPLDSVPDSGDNLSDVKVNSLGSGLSLELTEVVFPVGFLEPPATK